MFDRLWPRRRRREVPTWYDRRYRLPLTALEGRVGVEPRRADLVAWFLVDDKVMEPSALRAPERVGYADLARVHAPEYLESLGRPETLARIFAVDPSDVPVDELLQSLRLACGGTLAAAREALRRAGPTLNLLGGFHHAGPASGGGLCAVNDVAVAIASLRADGERGRIAVLDLDAHPPDGTAACLRDDGETWIGSLSGAEWEPLPRVDEVVLPAGCGDERYLEALEALLARMPRARLSFVLAGGDVLAGDRLGRLGLTLAGARRRDLRIVRALDGAASVWLPAGGYHPDAWRVLAGTALALARRTARAIPASFDPLSARFSAIAAGLGEEELRADVELTQEDLEGSLERRPPSRPSLLGYYSAEGLEYALFRYGLLDVIARLGYRGFRVSLSPAASGGDRVCLHATDGAADPGAVGAPEHLLIDCVLEKRQVGDDGGGRMLYVHWLTLRNPRARFGAERPQLPGQEVPGLGLAREIAELLARIAERLGLDGVAFRPAGYHIAYAARHHFRFVEPARQGRFEALVRDLAGVPLLEASLAIEHGEVRMNGEPYRWEADEMVHWLRGHDELDPAVAAERDRVRFTRAARAGAGS